MSSDESMSTDSTVPEDAAAPSDSASARRMATEADASLADAVQEVVDEVAASHSGQPPEHVVDAVQQTWEDKHEEHAVVPPLDPEAAREIAEHVSEGRDVVVTTADPAPEAPAGGSQ